MSNPNALAGSRTPAPLLRAAALIAALLWAFCPTCAHGMAHDAAAATASSCTSVRQ